MVMNVYIFIISRQSFIQKEERETSCGTETVVEYIVISCSTWQEESILFTSPVRCIPNSKLV
jgi:hypothetical protein